MGQKINPFGYRLGITENHRSKWFSDSNKAGERYRDFVLEDDQIRKEMSKVSSALACPASSSSAPATAFASTFTPPVRAS